uniref:Secreted protein n=1 Tax=Nothobranchius furzeri TaxID=105023 RepID=A0A8C6PUJ1_NOTFU
MMSVCSILLAVAVFSELNRLSVIMAVPSAKVEDGAPEQEVMDQILGDETLTEPAVGPSMYRRSLMLDNSMKDDGIPKVIIIPCLAQGHDSDRLSGTRTCSLPITGRALNSCATVATI